jgi:3-methyladenine DNA glycosylase AlkC
MSGLNDMELKERVRHLVDTIARHLSDDFEASARILFQIRNHWDEGTSEDCHRPFAAWPIIDYVAKYGIDSPETSLPLLRYLTPMFSAEFAVRPFLEQHPDITYNEMTLWCLDPDEHVRRLASEGIRPRLPWAPQLKQYISDPTPVIALLDNLVDDPSDYVRRSVANNLNDISKDHPELVIATCQRWMHDKISARQWIIKRATRTLVKAGHPKVFSLLGYTRSPKIEIDPLEITPSAITLGESLELSTTITSTAPTHQKLVIDYAIHFQKANGHTKPKVFKWKNLTLKPAECVHLQKKHLIEAITTRHYYPGTHRVDLLINGKTKATQTFELHITDV